jgi:hypothetical protein
MGHARKRKAERRQSEALRLRARAKGWKKQRVADWSPTLPAGPSVVVYQTTLRSEGGQGK